MQDESAVLDDVAAVARHYLDKIRRVAGKVPFAVEATALYYAMLDSRTPLKVKAMTAAALLYFIAPLDAVADLLPLVGFSDDAAVLFATYRALRAHVTEEHLAAARRLLYRDEPNASNGSASA
jgi:uncharacterized membrane protein YkvA (DUF1232 family)